jgi:HK97 family phage major capsid protein
MSDFNHKELLQLQDRRAECVRDKKAIHERAAKKSEGIFDDVDTKEWHALTKEVAAIEASLDRIEEIRAEERAMVPVPDINQATPEEVREREGTKEPEKFTSFGEQAIAIVHASRAGGYVDPRLIPEGAGVGAAVSGLSEGIPADGGFLVQTDFQSALMTRLHETSVLWGKAKNIPISSNSNGVKINAVNETSRADGSRWGGVQAYWAAEAAAKTDSKPEFRQIELNLKKLIGLCYATDELLQDATALEGVLMEAFPEEFGFKLDDAIINGLGAGLPLGILASGCLVTVVAEVGQAPRTIVYENIMKMWAQLWAPSQARSVWLINQSCYPELFNMSLAVGTGGSAVYIPPGGASASPYGTLFGRPVIPIEQAATLGTAGDIILADMSQYITATKGGIQTASSIHLRFNYDETTFRWVFRADGQPSWNSSLTPYKDAATSLPVSPFVVLATRA